VTTFDIARKKFSVEESKRQVESQEKKKERDEQEKDKQEYYKKRNTQKGRMLERKGGQPVMKHMIGDMLAKIKKSNRTE
jgi:rRNA processing